MTPRTLIALVGAAIVGAGLYLFLEVRADPPIVQAAAPVTERPGAQPAHGIPGADAPAAARPGVPPVPPALPTISAVPAVRSPEEAEAAHDQALADVRSSYHARPTFKMKPDPVMDRYAGQAQDAYDKGDLARAQRIAAKVLQRSPTNPQMLRVVVAASCAEGDTAHAQQYYAKMTPAERVAMKQQCSLPLTDPSP